MKVEERKGSTKAMEAARAKEHFPVGMRVLAVDDDPVCLKLLEMLLLRCRYQVTTTNQAIMALKLLRENKDKFDLVISDVHMPDMDGFKLLELVGLEMDLPVIMLSVNGETKTVMKGISHGACDYLLKPVRIEELRNIWQHVVRKKKSDGGDRNNCDDKDDLEKGQNKSCEDRQGPQINGLPDQSGLIDRKRKSQNEEDEDDCEDNANENEEPSTHKRPRVVWSIELHRKFVAAVNQLGIDKAVPKRILELMNVEKLTRENVASHLQKYRLYLKRLSVVASQQANIVAAFGARDPSFLHIDSFDGFGNFHTLASSDHLPAFTFQTTGVLNRREMASSSHQSLASGIVQFGNTQNNTSLPMIGKLPQFDLTAVQHGSLLQAVPTSLELDQLQAKRIQEAKSLFSGCISRGGLLNRSSSSSDIGMTSTPLMMQAHKQQSHSEEFNIHSLSGIATSSDPFQMIDEIPSDLPDLGRCNGNWPGAGAAQLSGFVSDTLPTGSSTSNHLPNITANATMPLRGNYTTNNTCSSVILTPQIDPLILDDLCQTNPLNIGASLLLGTTTGELNAVNFSSAANSILKLEETNQNHIHENELIPNSFHSSNSTNLLTDPLPRNQRLDVNNDNRNLLRNKITNPNASSLMMSQNSNIDGFLKQKDGHVAGTSELKGGLVSNGCNYDDLFSSMIRPEREDNLFMDSEIGCDFYSIGACI